MAVVNKMLLINMKKLLVISIALPAIILILVLAKVFNRSIFKTNAQYWMNPSVSMSNYITTDRLRELGTPVLIIYIGEEGEKHEGVGEQLEIPAHAILDKESQRKIRPYKKGTIVLFSENESLNARIWMILSQMGYENLYILDEKNDNEVLKYKFRPDTGFRPELQSLKSDNQ